jgi:predicted dehydrogenase
VYLRLPRLGRFVTDTGRATVSTSRVGASGKSVLTVGIVGAGEVVTRIHLPVLSACENVRLSYIADKDARATKLAASTFGAQPIVVNDKLDTLPQTDVALLAVPVAARLPYHELFAQRGTCVLSEKPLATCLGEAERICGLYPEYALACGFQRRSYATANLARLAISENWFGRLRGISVSEGALTTKTGADARFYDEAGSGGGVLMDLGCHSLDLSFYLTGAPGVKIVEQRFVMDNGVDREVEAHMLLQTPVGSCDFDYFVTWLRPAENLIRLYFDNCVASLPSHPADEIELHGVTNNHFENDCLVSDRPSNERANNDPSSNGRFRAFLSAKAAGASTVYQAFYIEWMAFLDGIRNQRPSHFNARSALATVKTVEMLYEAGRRPE